MRTWRTRGGRDRGFACVEAAIEPDLVYPLVRWGDVSRFRAVPSAYILLAQRRQTRRGYDEDELRRHQPKTFAYLARFRQKLVARAAYKRYQSRAAFYSMYNIGDYTLADNKVVWRRMDKRINAAVLEPVADALLGPRPIVPQETCVIIATETADEAHYLAAVLNSRRSGLIATGHSVLGGKGFGTPGMIDYLGIARFNPSDRRHLHLTELSSRRAHELAGVGADLSEVQAEIDRAVKLECR